MKCLTLWDPYASAIVYGTKRIENRPWKPPAAMIGQRFGVHVGKRYDKEAENRLSEAGLLPSRFGLPGTVIGVATIIGVVTESDEVHGSVWLGAP